MISEGKGMQADSMAISKTTPEYPSAEIVPTIKTETASMILATIFVFWVPGLRARVKTPQGVVI